MRFFCTLVICMFFVIWSAADAGPARVTIGRQTVRVEMGRPGMIRPSYPDRNIDMVGAQALRDLRFHNDDVQHLKSIVVRRLSDGKELSLPEAQGAWVHVSPASESPSITFEALKPDRYDLIIKSPISLELREGVFDGEKSNDRTGERRIPEIFLDMGALEKPFQKLSSTNSETYEKLHNYHKAIESIVKAQAALDAKEIDAALVPFPDDRGDAFILMRPGAQPRAYSGVAAYSNIAASLGATGALPRPIKVRFAGLPENLFDARLTGEADSEALLNLVELNLNLASGTAEGEVKYQIEAGFPYEPLVSSDGGGNGIIIGNGSGAASAGGDGPKELALYVGKEKGDRRVYSTTGRSGDQYDGVVDVFAPGTAVGTASKPWWRAVVNEPTAKLRDRVTLAARRVLALAVYGMLDAREVDRETVTVTKKVHDQYKEAGATGKVRLFQDDKERFSLTLVELEAIRTRFAALRRGDDD